MGVRISTAELLQKDDEVLIKAVEEGYWLDRQRVERIIEQAKQRYLEDGGKGPPLVRTQSLVRQDVVRQDSFSSTASPLGSRGSESDGPNIPSRHQPLSIRNGSIPADQMAALWEFEGHKLKELQSGLESPKRHAPYARSASGVLDEDGHPILYGCCGRDKKYARCAVCYFRKRRSNTAHYCACCQRPVCIRPRTYDGETHPMICWNVLHLDEKMMDRVKQRKARQSQEIQLVSEVRETLDNTAL